MVLLSSNGDHLPAGSFGMLNLKILLFVITTEDERFYYNEVSAPLLYYLYKPRFKLIFGLTGCAAVWGLFVFNALF